MMLILLGYFWPQGLRNSEFLIKCEKCEIFNLEIIFGKEILNRECVPDSKVSQENPLHILSYIPSIVLLSLTEASWRVPDNEWRWLGGEWEWGRDWRWQSAQEDDQK